jgi:hypothetical protein
MDKTLFLFLVLLSVTSNAITKAQNIDLVNLIPKCKPAVISISTFDRNNNPLATGTGFFIDSLGTALTCYHVFEGASSAFIKTFDNRTFPVYNIISQNKDLDIIKFSVINEPYEYFKYLSINKYSVKEGEPIFVIGNPFGLENSISEGIVSSIRDFTEFGRIIQITAPISAGSSGSPLLNRKGEAIGIIKFTYTEGQNLNFATNIQELNLLLPVNKLVFPTKNNSEKSISSKTFQRANWCATKEAVSQIEESAIIDKSNLTIELNSQIKKKTSSASVVLYRNIYISDIKVNIEYTFNYNCLIKIQISSSNSFFDEYKSLNELLKEFIILKNTLSGIYENLNFYFLFENTKSKMDINVFRNDNIEKLAGILSESGGYYGLTCNDYENNAKLLVLIYGKEMQFWSIDIERMP